VQYFNSSCLCEGRDGLQVPTRSLLGVSARRLQEQHYNSQPMTAEKPEIHKFLVEDLSDQRKRLADFAFKHGTLTFLLLGWIVTSKDAHELIPEHPVIRFGLVAIAIGYAIFYAWWVHGLLQISRDTCTKIDQNGYMERSLYSHLTITPRLAWSYILMQCSLCAWMAIFLCVL
jgi:hypothetical protein